MSSGYSHGRIIVHRIIVATLAMLSSIGAAAEAPVVPWAAAAEATGAAATPDPAAASPLVATPVEAPEPVLTVTVMPGGDVAPVATVTLLPTPALSAEATMALPALPMATPAAALPSALKITAKARPGQKPKVAKAKTLQKLLLSRTARQQMALFASRTDDPAHARVLGDDDVNTGTDVLDLHVFYGRPEPVKDDDQDDGEDDDAISETVRLRLFLARMKAVEAHAVARAAQDEDATDELSDKVKARLAGARMAALEAHRKKFS